MTLSQSFLLAGIVLFQTCLITLFLTHSVLLPFLSPQLQHLPKWIAVGKQNEVSKSLGSFLCLSLLSLSSLSWCCLFYHSPRKARAFTFSPEGLNAAPPSAQTLPTAPPASCEAWQKPTDAFTLMCWELLVRSPKGHISEAELWIVVIGREGDIQEQVPTEFFF